MARRVFFSFHYDDILRVAQIRNSWRFTEGGHANRLFEDAAEWEKLKRRGVSTVSRWIDQQLRGTSVTVVLIGPNTHARRWVRYEIEQSLSMSKGLLGIHMNGMSDPNRGPYWFRGSNPFDQFKVQATGLLSLFSETMRLSNRVYVYDWVDDDGRKNLKSWIEAAAKAVGR